MPSWLCLVPSLAPRPHGQSHLELFLRQSESSPDAGGGPLSHASFPGPTKLTAEQRWRRPGGKALPVPLKGHTHSFGPVCIQTDAPLVSAREYPRATTPHKLTPSPSELKAAAVEGAGFILMFLSACLTLLEEDGRFET